MSERGAQILLVEDDPGDVALILDALTQGGVDSGVRVVRDGAEALDFLFRRGARAGRPPDESPRLVLLDLKLPKVSGLEVLRQVKSDPGSRSIPVVVLTSSRIPQDIANAYGLGANSYVVKPTDSEEFEAAVQQVASYWLEVNQPADS